jgi:hypothetical protein
MNFMANPTLSESRTPFSAKTHLVGDDQLAWVNVEIDKGIASPVIRDQTAQQVMADIKAKNREAYG